MTAKERGMKFDLGQKVFIKTMNNKEGIITGWFVDYKASPVKREYDVWYKDTNLGWESHYPSVMEYLGPKSVTARVSEEDLAPFTTVGLRGVDGAAWAEAKNHMFDPLRYAVAVTKNENAVVKAARVADGQDLDLVGTFWGISRLPNETDAELRIRILNGIHNVPITVNIEISDSGQEVGEKVSAAIKANCTHSWTTYTGFTDTFDYCQKCNCRKIG